MLADVLEVLDACDADLRMVISLDLPELKRLVRDPAALVEGNRRIYELTRRAPDRLFGGCMINPNFEDESLHTMRVCFEEWGFVMFGEMLQYMMDYQMDSDAVERLVRVAVGYGAPVQVHISTSNSGEHPSSHGMAQLRDLFGLMARVPEAQYILAHAVGMPDDNPPVVDAYLDAVEERFHGWPDGLWLEIRDFNSPGLRSALARVPMTRLLAGTDWTTRIGPPFLPYLTVFNVERAEDNPFPPKVASVVGFLRDAGATDEAIERIAHLNAEALFGERLS